VLYATRQDLEDYFGVEELRIAADRDGDGVADDGVITSALNAASEEIDSYVGVQYDLPLTTIQTPGILMNVCADIAMYRMSIDAASITEDKHTRYKDAVVWLTKISKGTVTLGREEEQEAKQDEVELASATVSAPSRLFTRTKMAGIL
jgi:phage gp36-like protein